MYAFRALFDGVANAGQQKLFLNWLRYVTEMDHMTYRPGADGRRDTDFAEGKRFVGRELFKLLHPLYTPQKSDKRPSSVQQRLNQRRKLTEYE